MFQAIISVCNLINMECVLLKDKIGLINTHKQCKIRAESMRKDFIDLYKGPVIIEKNCIKINNYKRVHYKTRIPIKGIQFSKKEIQRK